MTEIWGLLHREFKTCIINVLRALMQKKKKKRKKKMPERWTTETVTREILKIKSTVSAVKNAFHRLIRGIHTGKEAASLNTDH